MICSVTCGINISVGVSTFDKCLDVQAEMNQKYIGVQLSGRLYFTDGSGYHVNFGCFEYKLQNDKKFAGINNKLLRLRAWNKFGPYSKPPPDSNIRRVLKRQFYDYPRPPWQQVPGKRF